MVHALFNYEHEGLPLPGALRVLAQSGDWVTVKRTDDRTLEVESNIYLYLANRILRSEENPLKRGETVSIARMTATVLPVNEDNRPQKVAFRFETPLEDPSLRWLRRQNGEYVTWTPPKVGKEVRLEPED